MPSTHFVSAEVPASEVVIVEVQVDQKDDWVYYSRVHETHAQQYLEQVKTHKGVKNVRIRPSSN